MKNNLKSLIKKIKSVVLPLLLLTVLSVAGLSTTVNATYNQSPTVTPTPTKTQSVTATPTVTPTPIPCNTPLDQHQFKQALTDGKIRVAGINVNPTDQAWLILYNDTNCPVQVSLSSYKLYSEDFRSLSTQKFFQGTGLVTVNANSSRVLTMNIPSCRSQLDFWYGLHPIVLSDEATYAYVYPNNPFLVKANYGHKTDPVCTDPTPTPTATPTPTPVDEDDRDVNIDIDVNQSQNQSQNQTASPSAQVAGVSEFKELPKTGLPLIAYGFASLLPAGFGLKRFASKKTISEDTDNAQFIWEQREYLKK